MSGIRWHERVFVAGYTGSGKSELLNHLFSRLRCQRLLLDTKPEFAIPGVTPVQSVEQIDWTQPVIHYQAVAHDLDDYDELFDAAIRRRNLTICVHELADLCEDQPNRTPKMVRAYIRNGNIRGLGLLGASQRPVSMPRISRTEAQHIIAFNPPVDHDDRKVVARMMQRRIEELDQALAQARARGERHSFVWYDRGAQTLRVSGPLPDHIRHGIIVRRAVNLGGDHEPAQGREQTQAPVEAE